MLTGAELRRVGQRVATVPITSSAYIEDDLGTCLVRTVVDFQMHATAVARALAHFESHRASRAATLEDFERSFAAYPDTRDGNEKLAEDLLGYKMWTRVGLLRALVRYFAHDGVSDLAGLREWAERSDFQRDFQGRVQYVAGGRTFRLGPAVYSWLVMRLGAETVKPEARLHRFVETTLGHPVSETDVVTAIVSAAKRIGVPPRQLHWSICQEMRA